MRPPPGPTLAPLLAIALAMEAACREQGIAALHLEVDHDNEGGKRLYLQRGFVDHPRHLMTKWLDR